MMKKNTFCCKLFVLQSTLDRISQVNPGIETEMVKHLVDSMFNAN